MIDITKAKEVFKEYVKKYDESNGKIAMKIAHIYRTAEIAKRIAKEQNLSQEDVELAELIGLLHDIGRFEQAKRYNTFVDKNSVNHGELGVQILFEDGMIRKFIEENKYDEIIKQSIINHNKSIKILNGIKDEKILLHTKIIRDADKTDIYYTMILDPLSAMSLKDNNIDGIVSEEVKRAIREDKDIDYSKKETVPDALISQLLFVYDFNFDTGLKIVYENRYIETFIKQYIFTNPETRKIINEVVNMCNQYIKNRLMKEC